MPKLIFHPLGFKKLLSVSQAIFCGNYVKVDLM